MDDISRVLGWLAIAVTFAILVVIVAELYMANRPRRNLGQHVHGRRRK